MNVQSMQDMHLTEDMLRLALDVCPVAMMLVRTSGEICAANPAACELFGYLPQDLIGSNVDILVPEPMRPDHAELRDAFQTYSAKRQMGSETLVQGVTAEGALLPLEIGLQPSEVDGARVMVVTIVDLRAQFAQQERVQNIMDASASAMLLIEKDGNISYASNRVEAILGHHPADLIGASVETLLAPTSRLKHRVVRRNFMHDEGAKVSPPHRSVDALHKNGRLVPVEVTLDNFDNDEGRVVATIVDLSERVAAESELAQRTRDLEQLNENLSRFAYSVSHDLKAPLASIAGLMSLCVEDLEDNDLDELRANLGQASQIATNSLNDIEAVLQVAVSNSAALEIKEVALAEKLHALWADLASVVPDARMTLSENGPGTILTEPPALRAVFRNLMENAIKYRQPDRALELCIETHAEADKLAVRVADNGRGIPEDVQPQVFDLFRRHGENCGTGIGLSIVRQNVRRLGGEISLESTPGVGTAFVFFLPLAKDNAA